MNRLVYAALTGILRLNDRLYGRGASREVLRDLQGDWQAAAGWREVMQGRRRMEQDLVETE